MQYILPAETVGRCVSSLAHLGDDGVHLPGYYLQKIGEETIRGISFR